MKQKFLVFLLLNLSQTSLAFPSFWGFFGHQKINRLAIFTLPPEMIGFYKKHLPYIVEHSVSPDARRYAVKEEAPRHFIDLDAYPADSVLKIHAFWTDAVKYYSEDSLMRHGIVPWHIQHMKFKLTKAFEEKDTLQILRYSAEIGHYIADANVPLHTTKNYNGQLTGQNGIHAFWESRLVELYSDKYNFFVGKACYLKSTQKRAWDAVYQANACLDSVLNFEQNLSQSTKKNKKYSIDERNNQNVKTYSREFSEKYHNALHSQVERQMRSSIKMIGDFWFTCWVDAGQPNLSPLMDFELSKSLQMEEAKEKKSWFSRIFSARDE
ncbi:MAG: S1/P1 Nuclease [Pseudarcicella sp.]|nr:S1/P1 Nuclease [Pseudarcicella sp.]MBP6409964.1 S1/P1 Nuclease [Pseudarcicella sp.]